MGLIWYVSRRYPTQSATSNEPSSTTFQGYLHDIGEGFRYIRQSALLRWMAASALLTILILVLLEYITSKFLFEQLRTTEAIAGFTGPVIAISSLIMFPFQLFVLGRIIGRIGVSNANMMYPLGNLAISGVFVGFPALPTAALAYFNRNSFYPISFMVHNLLYNAVPLRVQGRARAFTGGLVLPIGAVLGGAFLLLVQSLALEWLAPLALLVLALGYVASNWMMRQQYTQALIATLEEEDFSFQLARTSSNLRVIDPTMLAILKRKLDESDDEAFTVFIARLISQVGGEDALPLLRQLVRTTESAYVRSSLLDVLANAGIRSESARTLFVAYLNDPAPPVRRSALNGLADLYGTTDRALFEHSHALLHDTDTEVQARALSLLLVSPDASQRAEAKQALEQLLGSSDVSRRASAVQVLGQTGQSQYARVLITYLKDPSDEVRLKAAVAFEQLLAGTLPGELLTEVVSQMNERIYDPIERVRLAALLVLGYIGETDSLEVFIESLTDSSPQIRSVAADILVQFATVGTINLDALTVRSDGWTETERFKRLRTANAQPGKIRAIVPALLKQLASNNEQMRRMV
ncbi:MAG: hypothetical protein HC893_09930, partial [Chloroflexaceae bacterium]|nr:hypothetical protein [Chloroflexaceae bacterium]